MKCPNCGNYKVNVSGSDSFFAELFLFFPVWGGVAFIGNKLFPIISGWAWFVIALALTSMITHTSTDFECKICGYQWSKSHVLGGCIAFFIFMIVVMLASFIYTVFWK